MEQVVADSLWELNLYRWLIGLFAALALVLAAIGLYGVISYNVTSRTREFAVRLALGSDPMGLARIVLTRGAWLASAGLAAGVLGALAVRPLLRDAVGQPRRGSRDVCGDRGAAARDRARRVRPPGDPRRPREPRRRAPARLARFRWVPRGSTGFHTVLFRGVRFRTVLLGSAVRRAPNLVEPRTQNPAEPRGTEPSGTPWNPAEPSGTLVFWPGNGYR